jgi:hypothetical protein
MYEILTQDDGSFNLIKNGGYVGTFSSLENAQKAKGIAEMQDQPQTGTWADKGDGTDYPEGAATSYHSGDWCDEKPLTFEDRFDAVLRHLADVHGIHMPCHLAPPPAKE